MTIDLFEPYRIGSLEVRNRWVRSATWDGTANESGVITDNSVGIYRELGKGGIGLIVSGYAFVSAHGQASPGQYGVHSNDMIPGLRRMTEAAHEGGAKIAIQIVHAGINSGYLSRKGIEPLAISRMPRYNWSHREMTGEDIEGIVVDFATAAVRAREAGFDAIQLHGAHGFLMSQIESPIFNRRSDLWGGNAKNRRRFHLEVIRRIRKAIGGEFPLMIKFGLQDDREGGLSLKEGVETARQMVVEGIDAIEVSAGIGNASLTAKENGSEQWYFQEGTAVLKREVDVPVIAVGGIRSLEIAQDMVDSRQADMISMCRPLIREPGLIGRWESGDRKPARCISCNRCFGVIARGIPMECGEELRLREEAERTKKVE